MNKHYPPKPRPKSKAAFFKREEELWHKLSSCWNGVDEKILVKPGANGKAWSMKDVINHVAAWLMVGKRVIPDLLDGKKAALGTSIDTYNNQQFEKNKEKSLKQSLDDLDQARKDLLPILKKIPEEKLLDPNTRLGNWAKYSTYGHYMEHISNLEEFLEENR